MNLRTWEWPFAIPMQEGKVKRFPFNSNNTFTLQTNVKIFTMVTPGTNPLPARHKKIHILIKLTWRELQTSLENTFQGHILGFLQSWKQQIPRIFLCHDLILLNLQDQGLKLDLKSDNVL